MSSEAPYTTVPVTQTKEKATRDQPSKYYDKRLNEKCLSLDLENLHDLLSQKSEWINIQPTIKGSVRHLLNITVQQQNQINHLNARFDSERAPKSSNLVQMDDFKKLVRDLQEKLREQILQFQGKYNRHNESFVKSVNKALGRNKEVNASTGGNIELLMRKA